MILRARDKASSKAWSAYVFDIGVAYKENTDRVIEVMTMVGDEMMKDEVLGPLMLEEPEIFGAELEEALPEQFRKGR